MNTKELRTSVILTAVLPLSLRTLLFFFFFSSHLLFSPFLFSPSFTEVLLIPLVQVLTDF